MQTQILRTFALGTALTASVFAQNNRQASIRGGGDPGRGKCTLEVVVDGVSQVEIRGAMATLRNISGQPPQWRRFECTSAMPPNPANFRFAGVDGRGRQELIRDPRNGGAAVVQIEDKDGGAEGYTFDIMWESGGNPQSAGGYPPGYRDGGPPPQRPDNDRREGSGEPYRPNYRDSDYYRRNGHGFGTDEAVRVCQDAIMHQANDRFRSSDIHFLRTRIDDSPGRQDWVLGAVEVRRGPREMRYGFSCSVNFDNGRVRSAQLDERPMRDDRR